MNIKPQLKSLGMRRTDAYRLTSWRVAIVLRRGIGWGEESL
jgi:hypothetical protein